MSVRDVFQACIGAMSHTQCIGPLKQSMQCSRDMIATGCETLNRLFSANQDQLVKQVNPSRATSDHFCRLKILLSLFVRFVFKNLL